MRFLLIITVAFALLGCKGENAPNTLKVGTIAGPETELVKAAIPIAKTKYDLTIKIVEFSDYNLPNEALQDGSLDANVYQHLPYLEAAQKAHHYDFVVIGKTFVYPTGIYSNKYQSLEALPNKARIAIPNDPSNEARALLLLQHAGLIQLKSKSMPDVKDIVANPRQFRFSELDAAQLPRVLADVDAAVINTTFAIPAGLDPAKDSLYLENKDSPYANLIVAKRGSSKQSQLNQLVQALHDPAVVDKAKKVFGNSAIPAW